MHVFIMQNLFLFAHAYMQFCLEIAIRTVMHIPGIYVLPHFVYALDGGSTCINHRTVFRGPFGPRRTNKHCILVIGQACLLVIFVILYHAEGVKNPNQLANQLRIHGLEVHISIGVQTDPRK